MHAIQKHSGESFFSATLAQSSALAAQSGAAPVSVAFGWNNRLKTAFGWAWVVDAAARTAKVELSVRWWVVLTAAERANVVRHELAHVWAELEQEGSDHGLFWQEWALRFGADPTATIAVSEAAFKAAGR